MVRFVVGFFAIAGLLLADERTQRLTARLAEEAAAFQRVAPRMLGRETLVQRAQKPARRFRVRVGKAATVDPEPEWQERTLISEYGFTTFAASQGGGAIHELRQVVSVDGKPVKSSVQDPEALARIIVASDDGRKRELLKQFQEYGLVGAANDFGQIILLFTAANMPRYEFSYAGRAEVDGKPVLGFSYKQIDGPNPLTVVDVRRDRVEDLKIEGEVWVHESTYLPIRVTMASTSGQSDAVREEAIVIYAFSRFGSLLPKATRHREIRGGKVVAENNFTYTDFKRFGASTDIQFETQ
ncbi:MAG: hypothetical protein ABI811_00450 [Acidobacteriota bacterium]